MNIYWWKQAHDLFHFWNVLVMLNLQKIATNYNFNVKGQGKRVEFETEGSEWTSFGCHLSRKSRCANEFWMSFKLKRKSRCATQ
jgi:hypothetical protein